MRYILIILVFISVGAKAQMVIKAHPNYRPFAVSVCGDTTRLLDSYTGAAAAYSLRKLRAGYTGAAIRVRKDTVGQPESDIGFDICGNLDTNALKSFLNARSGFVTTWYSQGDSTSVNFEQSTQANQPRIALNGVIDRRNNLPTILFSATFNSIFLTVSSSTQKFAFLHQAGLSSVIVVGATGGAGSQRVFIDNHNTASANRGYSMQQIPTAQVRSQVARGVSGAFFSVNTTLNNFIKIDTIGIIYNELDNGNATAANRNKLYYNNGNAISNNTSTNVASSLNASFNIRIGVASNDATLYPFSGFMSEIIFYKGDKTSDRTGIRNAINTYYAIY